MGFLKNMAKKLASKAHIAWFPHQSEKTERDHPAGCISPTAEDSSSCTSSESDLNFRTLSPEELAAVLQGVGAQDPTCPDKVAHPTNSFWPPSKMPRGLYRDVLTQKAKYTYLYYGMTALQWTGVAAQIVLGAILAMKANSAFGGAKEIPEDNTNGTGFTQSEDSCPTDSQSTNESSSTSTATYAKLGALIAANTINAALVSTLRAMGLIPRFNRIMSEFGRVENHIRQVADTGIVNEELETANEVIYSLYEEYNKTYCKISKTPPPIPVHCTSKQD